MSDFLEEMKSKMIAKVKPTYNEPDWDLGLSLVSTTLNLACSGRPDIGLAPDNYYVWSGSSGSGKTVLGLSILAEASINPNYSKHRLIYDATESGALMNLRKFYGKALADRLEPPDGTRDDPKSSGTLEGFYHNVFSALKTGPCVYLLDSMDPLPTEKELKDFVTKNNARKRKKKEGEKEKKEPGSMGMERARTNSHYLRLIYKQLQGSGSILFVIFQSRQNVGPGAMFNPDTRGGGTAPTFYAGLELHSKVLGHLKVKESVSGKSIEQGVNCKITVKKGRIQGKTNRPVTVPIYHSGEAPGIDDIGGCVDYMAQWKRWPKTGEEYSLDGKIDAVDFNINASREKVIQHIINNNLIDDLRKLVTSTWNDIESSCVVVRPRRYE